MPVEVHFAGDPLAVSWVTLPDADALELLDPVSGRSTTVVRPPDAVLTGEVLVGLESLAFAWADVPSHDEADRQMAQLVETNPTSVLTGLSWILALWCVVSEMRTGVSAVRCAITLEYQGEWRKPTTPEAEHMWTAFTERIRIGVVAALVEDEEAIYAYRAAMAVPPNVARPLAWHTMALMDGFSQDMMRNQVNPKGLVRSFVHRTSPNIRPRRCFQRSR